MKDISSFIVKHEDLFRSKIKEVVAMGGAVYSEAREQIIPDSSASNNSTDLNAARHVYAECQQNNIPTRIEVILPSKVNKAYGVLTYNFCTPLL